MKLTTKGRYAVTAMMDLALHAQQSPVALAEVSRRQNLSLSYLEQLFSSLRKRGLVVSARGPGGGYRLGREAATICVADVISAVNENLDTTACGGARNCQGTRACLTHELWHDLSMRIQEHLEGISLADLMERTSAQGGEKPLSACAGRSRTA